MKMLRVRPWMIGTVALGLAAAPASAQLTVYDPTNYAQNLLQASRALQQVNNQIQSLQHEAQSLINEARNLASLPTSEIAKIKQSIDRTRQLIGEAQQIAYEVKDIDRVFDARYPKGSLEKMPSGQLQADAGQRWKDAVAAFQDSLRTQAGIVTNLGDTRTQMDALIGASQDAQGALQAAQAGNQLIALQTRQLADLTALIAAQNRASALESARRAADEAQGREQTRRFLAPNSGYEPQPVRLFHD